MARPAHEGFLIPNATDVGATAQSPQMAEPDQIDFNTLGNARYGVIEGCLVTVTGSSATVQPGTVLINGALVPVNGTSGLSIATSTTYDRYDLLVVDTSGNPFVKGGVAAPDPVFPDPAVNVTVLAAVYCKAGESNFANTVIDKRKILPASLLTKIAATAPLVSNRNGTGDMFRVNGDGGIAWSTDTFLQRTGIKTLRVTENLNVDGTLSVGTDITAKTVTATGRVEGSNLRHGSGDPGGLLANTGDLYQSDDGRLFIQRSGVWEQIATMTSTVPPGTVIQSVQATDVMIPLGWLPLNGSDAHEATHPKLFTIPALIPYIVAGGTAGTRTMKLPDATKRVLLTDFTKAASYGGSSEIILATTNMPPHRHNAKVLPTGGQVLNASTSLGGGHGHRTVTGSGLHDHPVIDPGHVHIGSSTFGGDFIGLVWGGQNKIDAYFNDRSHTYSVEAVVGTMPAFTGITIGKSGSAHDHDIEPAPDHTHPVSVDNVLPHGHDVEELSVGGGTPLNYVPLHMTVFVYIRT